MKPFPGNWRFNVRRIGLVLAILLASFPVRARNFQFEPLDEKVAVRLPPAAREAYDRALLAVDRINYDVALDELNDAVKAAPNSAELRFVTIKLARYRGEMTNGVEAARHLDNAIEHAKAVMAMPDLSRRQHEWAEYELQKLDMARKKVDERDEARRTYGLQIAKQYAKEIYTQNTQTAEIKAFQEAIKSLTATGNSSSSTARAQAALAKTTAAAATGAKSAADTTKAGPPGAPAPTGAPAAPAAAPGADSTKSSIPAGAPGAAITAKPDSAAPPPPPPPKPLNNPSNPFEAGQPGSAPAPTKPPENPFGNK